MTKTATEIGAFEAKTHLSRLLRETEKGSSFIIRRRGRVVARLIPPADDAEEEKSIEELMAGLKEIRGRIRGKVDVIELVREGRRH